MTNLTHRLIALFLLLALVAGMGATSLASTAQPTAKGAAAQVHVPAMPLVIPGIPFAQVNVFVRISKELVETGSVALGSTPLPVDSVRPALAHR
jgi:hypothetical protein